MFIEKFRHSHHCVHMDKGQSRTCLADLEGSGTLVTHFMREHCITLAEIAKKVLSSCKIESFTYSQNSAQVAYKRTGNIQHENRTISTFESPIPRIDHAYRPSPSTQTGFNVACDPVIGIPPRPFFMQERKTTKTKRHM